MAGTIASTGMLEGRQADEMGDSNGNGLEPAQHAHRLPFARMAAMLGCGLVRRSPAILRLSVVAPSHINLVNDETESAF